LGMAHSLANPSPRPLSHNQESFAILVIVLSSSEPWFKPSDFV
jgi:hypothetical protein